MTGTMNRVPCVQTDPAGDAGQTFSEYSGDMWWA
jgi:hypothetical protein